MTRPTDSSRTLRLVTCLGACVALATAALPANGGGVPGPVGTGGAQASPLTIEQLYSLPRLIGTAPSSVVWSPDSNRIAFLWNDQGRNFRDIWVVDLADRTPRRLTRFPQPQIEDGGTDPEAILRRERAELDGGVSSLTWFPDGSALLAGYRGQLYRVPLDGEPAALGVAGRQAEFSPNNRDLSYIAEGEVWAQALDARGELSGEPRRLTALSSSTGGVFRYAWSPDGGRRLVALVRDASNVASVLIPDYLGEAATANAVPRPFPGEETYKTRLHVIEAESGASREMNVRASADEPIFTLEWSARGDRLLVDTSDLYVKHRRLLTVNATNGDATLWYEEREPDNVTAYWASGWAPDGGVYFISDRDDYYHLYRLPQPGVAPVAVTSGDWAVESFYPASDGVYVVTNAAHPAERQIYRVSAAREEEPLRLSERAGTHAPVFSPDGRWAAVLFSSDSTPPDLFLNRLDAPGEERLTSSPLPGFADHDWVAPEYVTFPSHIEGVQLHGRLMLPPDFDPTRQYPAIIGSIYSNTLRNQWGGRTAHPLWGLDQVLLQKGYVLLNIDIHGSWGHGRAFRRRLKLDYGGIDTEDIHSGARYLASLDHVDGERIGLWGSSYGGLMTAMSLFRRPGVFAAGVAGAPATNVWHALTGEMRVMGRPQDNPEAYADSSAFTSAAGLEDPLMIIHGMRDRIVLFKDSVQLYENLLRLGKGHLVDLVALPNAPHGWDTREGYQTRYAFGRLIEHFDRHLRPED